MGKRFIDAEKLERHFKNCIDEVRNTNGVTEDFEIALTATKNQPAADVQEVRHGTWRGYTKPAYIGSEDELGDPKYADCTFYRCSECRYGSVVKSNFCPNCGAKMDKED